MARARKAAGLRGAVNLIVTTEDRIREMNRRFRKKDKPTDVLSFPALDMPNGNLAGDVAICAEIAAENGVILGHGTATELKILLLHGLLHLAGHDHETDDGEMARSEQKLRRQLHLPEALIERNIAGRKSAHGKGTARSRSKKSGGRS